MPLLLLLVTVFSAALGASSARAEDSFARFERGRESYARGQYAEAARVFEGILEAEDAQGAAQPIVLESRKYLGASLLFLGRAAGAEEQFERLLEADPAYQLDPIAFPEAVLETFAGVRARVQREKNVTAERARQEAERARQEELSRLLEQEARLLILAEFARIERIERPNSRALALFPFGVGQFRNGHRKAGAFFAASQGLSAALALGTFIGHASLPSPDDPTQDRNKIRDASQIYTSINWASAGVFTLLYLISAIDAQVRFVPVRVEERERELPALSSRPKLELGPGGLGLRF